VAHRPRPCFGLLPRLLGWRPRGHPQVAGVASLCGMGFTMPLLIGRLAFDAPQYLEQAKAGILLGSAVSAGIGVILLRCAGPPVDQRILGPVHYTCEALGGFVLNTAMRGGTRG